jgi:tRNA-splicing ligase RtcB
VQRIGLANGRTLLATGDHQIRTKLGWQAVGDLGLGAAVACPVYNGIPHEDPPSSPLPIELPPRPPGRRYVDCEAQLREQGLWPLRPADPRFPALLRILGYAAGDGHLHKDGARLTLYTTVPDDAAALCGDLRRLGFTPRIHTRDRGPNRRREHAVYVSSVSLFALLRAAGLPAGPKIAAWSADPFPWLFTLPAWMRAHFLSAFASAEATTPALSHGCLAPAVIKQAATTDHIVRFLVRLIDSLGFRAGVSVSGPRRGTVVTRAVQILGGHTERLRFLEEVGFCRAVEKREAAARAASVAWATDALRRERLAAVAEARALAAAGDHTIREITALVARRHAVPRALAHHGIYGRGTPRRGKHVMIEPDHSGEVVWVPVTAIEAGGEAEVYDVVTGDSAESFTVGGICVHNCGNKAVRTALTYDEVAGDVPRIMDEVFSRISFGVGRKDGRAGDHPVIDEIRQAAFEPQREMTELAASQLGTVGAGNHYVDLFRDEADDRVWIGVHFGSRGFGHKTASGFLALAAGLPFGGRASEGEMMSPPVVFRADSGLGEAYAAAMELAGRYAYAGRDVVVEQVLGILATTADIEVHNNHNFAWRESVEGAPAWVVRKGATPAFPGQRGFVGATMGEPAVILEGVESADSRAALYSTVHGAGRAMSRTKAAGKLGVRMECSARDCTFWVARKDMAPGTRCPDHPDARLVKRRGRIRPGAIDFPSVQAELAAKGIELRGGAADEAPGAYKRLDEVLAHHAGTVRVLHRLRPVGVAMAPAETFDPYKD